MTETATQERTETAPAPQLAPDPQLPAVVRHRERARSMAQRAAPHYPVSIAKSVIAITREIDAIAKEGVHEFHKYRFMKWEDINGKLSPLLAQHGLFLMQDEQNRTLLEQNDKGSVLAIIYHFSFVHESGDMSLPVERTGIQRLRDQKGITDDKAAMKCHTQALKSFCVGTFNIRVAEEDHEDQRHTLPKKDARDLYAKLQQDIDNAQGVVELASWGKDNVERKRALPPDWQDILTTRYNEKMAELKGEPQVVWEDEHDTVTGEVK
jgi:hypothetical protein